METQTKELNLYIVRHGETEWNKVKRFQGSLDSPLTENGLKQAQALGEKLKEIKWDAIYVSPLGRAHKTAEIINVNHDPMTLMDDIKEMNFGDWEGCYYKDLARQEPLKFEQFWHEPADYSTMVGEDFYAVKDRSLKALKKIIAENPTGNVLIVTHTVIVKSMMAFFEERELEALWNPPFIGAASLSHVKLKGKAAKIMLHADSSHIIKEGA